MVDFCQNTDRVSTMSTSWRCSATVTSAASYGLHQRIKFAKSSQSHRELLFRYPFTLTVMETEGDGNGGQRSAELHGSSRFAAPTLSALVTVSRVG